MKKQGKLPKIAMFGGSVFLFPHPVKELTDFLKSYNMHINYDAAHVAGLIAGGKFQDPLREGVDTMTMSTHKTLFGPQGGLVLASAKDAEAIKKQFFQDLPVLITYITWLQRRLRLQKHWSLEKTMLHKRSKMQKR
uniref:Serine hydroxymethyltransferase (GlyA, SHMT) n=1 Tax=uncultured marine thaumarchaeote SAT1000_10_C05 TaxID=1456372 RepID=A0A075I9A9_9ARCH|nr:serine hydroxymethyltransferase (glyA, SHMT) [uncultured marine thaumarchaeote SAT1000_10_C05]